MMEPKILVVGMMNTKGTEIHFLAEKIREAGGIPVVADVTLGKEKPYDWVDIKPGDILQRIHMTQEDIQALSRGEAGQKMQEAGCYLVRQLMEDAQMDGIIGYAGGMGTSVITGMMRALPVGLPKIILSSVANAGFPTAHFFGTKDIYMANPIFEAGMNPVTRRILANGAYAVVGMARGYRTEPEIESRKSVGYVMLGVTTPCVLHAAEQMESRGYESMIVHGVGETIESLIEEGRVSALMDLTPNDIALNAVRPEVNKKRMYVAAHKGIPQVVAPGGIDLMVVTRAGAPEWLREEIERGDPERGLYPHVPDAYAVGTTEEECVRSGAEIARRLNHATAPVVVCVPLQGLSSADCGIESLERGWNGPGSCPLWVEDPENPGRSMRSRKFLEGFLSAVDHGNKNICVFTLDCHINDPIFAEFCACALDSVMHGKQAEISEGFQKTVFRIDF